MRSLFKVRQDEKGVTISLAIRLSPKEAGKVPVSSTEEGIITASDLERNYNEYGIGVLLALLRTYIFYCADDNYVKPRDPKRRKKKRRKKKK